MPHSPRWHEDKLWVLESGTGRLAVIDRATGQCETVAQCSGFTRGLAIIDRFAFIGLSKIRPTSAMDGAPLAARREQLKCGVVAIDLGSGSEVGFLNFETAVEEIFDVHLLVGIRFPEVIGFQNDAISHSFALPSGMASS
jgi:uncharacterized protein (TIGR03032 family)